MWIVFLSLWSITVFFLGFVTAKILVIRAIRRIEESTPKAEDVKTPGDLLLLSEELGFYKALHRVLEEM